MGDSDGFLVEEETKMKMNPSPPVSTVTNTALFSDVWPNVKPFVNGFLAGQTTLLQLCTLYLFEKAISPLQEKALDPPVAAHRKDVLNTFRKRIPVIFLFQAAYTTAQYGSFDFLTQKIEAANNGIPLTLYQEACCGLISGGIASCISFPLKLAYDSLRVGPSQSVEPKCNLRSLLFPLYLKARNEGLLALWRGSGYSVTRHMCMNMGLLTSYSRSLSYFRESVGLRNTEAQLGAGIVSAFFGMACSSSCRYIAAIKHIMLTDGGKKHSSRDLPFIISKVFQPGGGFNFYSGVLRSSILCTPIIVAQWMNLEAIREYEESLGF